LAEGSGVGSPFLYVGAREIVGREVGMDVVGTGVGNGEGLNVGIGVGSLNV